ncbi:unnamed protein product [Allacma fusca]|uniref:G-protein coupled receptors family 1 profile domain-containing protein n=1 Tax=Allacma fusca TaxID=39272 RepID=A0A8J2LB27_9HEXA|nr:unnamed protein product [Allacma fusca]
MELFIYQDWPDPSLKLYYSLALMILQYFFPLVVLVFTYTRIAVAVWGKRAPGEAEDGRDRRLAKSKRKMIKMMLTVVIVYTISWLPFNVIMVFSDVHGNSFWEYKPLKYIFTVTHWLAMSHTVWNPVIYCWMNSRFRVGFRSAVARLPIIKRLILGYNLNDYNHRLERMGTCTTFSFAGGNSTTLNRGSSVISNRTTFSEAGFTNSPHLVTDRLLDRDRSGARNSTGSNNNSPFANGNSRRSFSLSPRLNNNSTPFNTIVSCNSDDSPSGGHTTATMLPSGGQTNRRGFAPYSFSLPPLPFILANRPGEKFCCFQ